MQWALIAKNFSASRRTFVRFSQLESAPYIFKLPVFTGKGNR